MKFELKALRASVLVSASFAALAGTAVAQTEGEDEIIVRGSPIRDSQAAAIAQKRDAGNVVDIISADAIGRFPDQNLADSLNRLPGVAVERDQGQARYINFRGAPRRFTAIAFDGIDFPGAENGRIPRFDSFPAVVVSAVEANKAITADMPGEAVAGFINLRTFDPFTKDGISLSVEGGFGEQVLGDGDVERYNGRISWSNDTFGFVLFGSHNGRDQVTDNRELEVVDGGFATVEFRSYLVERQDNAYGGRVEFRGQDGGLERLFFSSIYSEFIDDELRNQFNFEFDAAGGTFALTGGEASDSFTGPVFEGDIGFDPFIAATRALQDGRYSNSTFTNTLGADFGVGDWAAEARLNYTQTENNTDLLLPFSTFTVVGGAYDFTNPEDPSLSLVDTLFGAGAPIDANEITYFANLAIPVQQPLDIDAYQVKLDASREGALFGAATTFKVGAKVDTREADGTDIFFAQVGAPDTVDFDAFDTGRPWPTDFNNSINGTIYDSEGLVAALRDAGADFDLEVPADIAIEIEENIYAAYAMATTDFDWGSLVIGGRIEATDFSSSGNSAFTPLDDEGDPTGPTVITPINATNDYVHFLPSVHLNYNLAEDTKLRLSLSTGVSRPTYVESRASVAVDVTDLATGGDNVTITGGNPNLDAEFAWGPDVSVEWYFADASLVSVATFARFIDNVIYAESTPFDDISSFDPVNIAAGTSGDFVSFENGKDGQIIGVEANFVGSAASLIDGPLGGFGLEANLTVLTSSFTIPELAGRAARTLSLPGTSDTIFGASVFYENYGLSARVNYTYRDDWLDETESQGNDQFWGEQQRVDVSVRYQLPTDFGGANATLFADGNNLTNETDIRYTNLPSTPNQVEGYGARWLAGLRVDY